MKLSFAVLYFVGNAVVALAQSPGTFTATGSMTMPRSGHTATLLPNGKVLIAGGNPTFSDASGVNTMATAELYNPFSAIFSTTDSMTTARYRHSAIALPDGRVLVAGGLTTGLLAVDTAELYDPSTEKFSPTGKMNAVHSCLSDTLLNNGKVLVVDCEPGKLAELYDPVTETFTPAGETTPCAPKSVLLPDGKVLLAQGSGLECADNVYPGAEIYDPAGGGLSPLVWTPWSYDDAATANLLPDGTVLMILQAVECDYGGQPLIYNPSTSAFTAGNTLGNICLPTGTVLSDGSVLITNGSGAPRAELYDSASQALSRTGDMNTTRANTAATLLNDGTVLLTGGTVAGPGLYPTYASYSTAELYHPGVVRPPPALFSTSPDGQGAIWQAQTGLMVSSTNPTFAGDVLSLYTNNLLDGGVIPPQISIGGRLAQVLYFGAAPGYPGYNQVNFVMPAGITPGPAVSVRLTYLGRSSNAVTIGAR